jgi:hypothetical protein
MMWLVYSCNTVFGSFLEDIVLQRVEYKLENTIQGDNEF